MSDLRCGLFENVLADVASVDAVICDPPYSDRTHEGHDDGATLANRAGKGWKRKNGGTDTFRARQAISYESWGPDQVRSFVDFWAPRNRGWFVCLSDSELCNEWRWCFEDYGLTGFQPIPIVIPGMTVRLSGDGPSSWAIYANVARPKALCKWGTLPGAYHGPQGEREHIGGKPEWVMRALVRDYSKPGDLVCDPCAGGGTTLVAAEIEHRRSIGAECDLATFQKAQKRLRRGVTPSLPFMEAG